MKIRGMNKFVLSVAVSLYSGISLLWCYIVFRSIAFQGYKIHRIDSEGEVLYDLSWEMIEFKYFAFRALFIMLSFATIILLTIILFKRNPKRIWYILGYLFVIATHSAFLLIPINSYLTDWFVLVVVIWSGFGYVRIAYHIVSIVMIGITFLLYGSTSVFTTKKREWL